MLPTGRSSGFTLVEVLLIVVIISFSLLLIIPSFDKYLKTVNLKTGESRIVFILTSARKTAIASGFPQKIEIHKSKLIYPTPTGEKVVFSRGIKNIDYNGKRKDIMFYPDGTSSGGKLEILFDNNVKVVLKISPVTGQLKPVMSHGS
ncbi:pilus assembly FimT family protein [Halothermothrix orenii]|uniref:Prepilin-type N-terminal cleavage/methylation domain protein n=1 Tax=Halothermothrix orenii (strain H 168 / OCM 544 / DSM 9562) TaxID=373903 RepID=B8CZ97_HALOH|nr:prepilin-type cleavage/methylation protein [Halothermothrix orenii]ACL70616.1 prepilin-type N-terminal cleavage/methylation domain protein [Halothermothrix orenii H 168]